MPTVADSLKHLLQGLDKDLTNYLRERNSCLPTKVRKQRLALAERIHDDVRRWKSEAGPMRSDPHQGDLLTFLRRLATDLEALRQENTSHNEHSTGRLAQVLQTRHEEVSRLIPRLEGELTLKLAERREHEAAFKVQRTFAKFIVKKKAARSSPETQQKLHAAYGKLMAGGLLGGLGLTFSELSERNLEGLRNAVGALDAKEQPLYDLFQGAKFYLTHATKKANLGTILGGTGELLSNVQLVKKIPNFKGNTFSIDRELFSNDDFVFFTIALADKHEKQYGDSAFVFDADTVKFFDHGWLSYLDFLASDPFTTALEKGQLITHANPVIAKEVVRTCKTVDQQYDGDDYSAEYEFTYPPTGRKRKLTLPELVLYGPHVREGLALSVILELRNMKLTQYLNGLQGEKLKDFANHALNTLYWLEAKLPADQFVRFMRFEPGTKQLTHSVWNKKSLNG